MEIVLRSHIVRFRRFELGMGGRDLPFGGDDSGIGIVDVRRSGLQLARGVHRSNGDGDIQRFGCRYGAVQIGLRLSDRNLIVLRVDLNQNGALLHPLIVLDVDFHHVSGNTRADRIQMNIRRSVVGRFIAAEVAPQKYAANNQHEYADQNQDVSSAPGAIGHGRRVRSALQGRRLDRGFFTCVRHRAR